MTYTYRTQGVCARGITFEIEDGIIRRVTFEGGCAGNTQGVARLAEGMSAAEAVEKLRGIRCGLKPTSCPDQLARALEKALENAG